MGGLAGLGRREERPGRRDDTAPARDYGIRLGLAGAIAAAIGFALDLATSGALRGSIARHASLDRDDPAPQPRSRRFGLHRCRCSRRVRRSGSPRRRLRAARMRRSPAPRRHAAPLVSHSLLTTFLVIVLLAQAGPNQAVRGFDERVAETALGVAIAYVFGMLVPATRERPDGRAPTTAIETI